MEQTINDITLEDVILASPMEGKKGECKYLKEPVCKLGYEIVNDDTCVDCESYEEQE